MLGAFFLTQVLVTPGLVQVAFATERPIFSAPNFWTERALNRRTASPTLATPPATLNLPLLNRAKTLPGFESALKNAAPHLRLHSTHIAHGAAPVFILVQDVHMNPEAQKNIGLGLEKLAALKKPWVLGVEAAHGPFDLAPHRGTDPAATRAIADYLLRENSIAAASWFGLVGSPRQTIVGVDDARLYAKNVAAFRKSNALTDNASRILEKEAARLDKERRLLSSSASDLAGQIEAYHAGRLPIAEHAANLIRRAPNTPCPQLAKLIRGVAIEKTLDIEAVNNARERFLREAAAGDASLDKFPRLKEYLGYIELADSIDHDTVFAEINALTREAAAAAAPSLAEKKYFQDLRSHQLAERLVRFELTPEDWSEYQRAPRAEFAPFENFYRYAEARNNAMLKNMLATMLAKPGAAGVLVAGGFHTPGLARLIKARGASYAVLTPRFASDGSGGSAYLSAFLRERSPLEKIFSGEKLTIASAAQNLGAPALGGGFDDAPARTAIVQAKLAAGISDGTLSADEIASVRASAGVPVTVTANNNEGRLTAGPMNVTVRKTAEGDKGGTRIPPFGTFLFSTQRGIFSTLKTWMPTLIGKVFPSVVLLYAWGKHAPAMSASVLSFSLLGLAAVILNRPDGEEPERESINENFMGLTGAEVALAAEDPMAAPPAILGTGWEFSIAFMLSNDMYLIQYKRKQDVIYVVWTIDEQKKAAPAFSLREDTARAVYITTPLKPIHDDWDRQRHLAVLYNALSSIEEIAFARLAERAPRQQTTEDHAFQENQRARHSLRVADSVVIELKDSVPEINAHFMSGPDDVPLSDRLDVYILLSHMRGTIPPQRPVYKEAKGPAARFGLIVDSKKSGVEGAFIRQLVGDPELSLKVIVGARPSQIFAILNGSRYGRFLPRPQMEFDDEQRWLRIHNSYIWVVENASDIPSDEWQRLGVWSFASTHDGNTVDARSRLNDAIFGPDRNLSDSIHLISLTQTPLRSPYSGRGLAGAIAIDTDSRAVRISDAPAASARDFLNALWEMPFFAKLRDERRPGINFNMDIPVTREASTLDESGRAAAGIANQLPLDAHFIRAALQRLKIDAAVVQARTLPLEMGAHTTLSLTFNQNAFFKAIADFDGPHLSRPNGITEYEMEQRILSFLEREVFSRVGKGIRPVFNLAGNAYVRGDARLHLDVQQTAAVLSLTDNNADDTVTLSFSFFYDPDWQNAQNLLEALKETAAAMPSNIQDQTAPRDPRESDYGYQLRQAADRRSIPPHPLELPARIDLIPRPLEIGILGAGGRIGHLLMRGLSGELNLAVRAVSGPSTVDELMTAIRRDSAHGAPLSNGREMALTREPMAPEGAKGALRINNGPAIVLLPRYNTPAQIPWAAYGVKLAVDASGRFDDPTERTNLAGHTKEARGPNDETGASMALFTGPFKVRGPNKAPDTTIVLPVTPEERIRAALRTVGQPIIFSAASCTTNCLVVLMDALNRMWDDKLFLDGLIDVFKKYAGEEAVEAPFSAVLSGATMVTVHAATNSQFVEDVIRKVETKERGALNAISLVETGASSASKQVGIKGDWAKQILAIAARAQSDTGSVVILTAAYHLLQNGVWPAALGDALKNKKKEIETDVRQLVADFHRRLSHREPYEGILEVAEPFEAYTSQNVASTNATAVFDAKQLQVEFSAETGRLVVMPEGWYDNERGSYTSQVLRLLNRIAALNYEEHRQRKLAARTIVDADTLGFTPVISAVTAKFGTIAPKESLSIALKITKDGLSVEHVTSPVEKKYMGLRYASTPIPVPDLSVRSSLHMLTAGLTEMVLTVPAGADVPSNLARAFNDLAADDAHKESAWPLAITYLQELNLDGPMYDILDRMQNVAGNTDSLRNLFSVDWCADYVFSKIGHSRFISFARFVLSAFPSDINDNFGPQDVAIIERLQRHTLQRLNRETLTEHERGALSRLNVALFAYLVRVTASDIPPHRSNALHALFRGFALADEIGVPYNAAAWGDANSKNWVLLRKFLENKFDPGMGKDVGEYWAGGLSFVPLVGLRIWGMVVAGMFATMLSNHGNDRSDVYAPTSGLALLKTWKLVDSSSDPVLKKTFYRVAAEHAAQPNHFKGFLEYASLQPVIFGRIIALLSLTRKMTHWQFTDNNMPWAFIIHLLRAPVTYADIKFKRLFVRSVLKIAPAVLGLPRDSDIRDFAKSGKNITPENLNKDEYDIDSAIDRHLTFVGVNQAAIEMIEARFNWWRTGDPSAVSAALIKHAEAQTRTWRQTLQPNRGREFVRRFFEILGHDDAPAIMRVSKYDLHPIRRQLEDEFKDQHAEIERFFMVEIPLYYELMDRFAGVEDDFNSLRAMSNSGRPINNDNINNDEFDLDRLVHRQIHHFIGEPALDLVEARFDYWRTGDLTGAVQLAEQIAPEQTTTWRKNILVKGAPRALVADLFQRLGEIPTRDLATTSRQTLDVIRQQQLSQNPGAAEAIDRLFNVEIPLFQQLHKRYEPARRDAALAALKNEKKWPVDVSALVRALETPVSVREKLLHLGNTRAELTPYLSRNKIARDREEPTDAHRDGYVYDGIVQQHEVRGIYGYTVQDTYYKAFQLDKLLQPIEQELLEEARAALKGKHIDYLSDAGALLDTTIGLLDSTGWGNQPLRNLRALLTAPFMTQRRLALIVETIESIYQSLGYWSDRQMGDAIDAISGVVSFADIAPALKLPLGINNAAQLAQNRLLMRTHIQSDLLRENFPLFFLKDLAQSVAAELQQRTDGGAIMAATESNAPAIFFPEHLFGDIQVNESLAVDSEKGANLLRLARLNMPVPPGIRYAIGLDIDAIWPRIPGDMKRLVGMINESGLNEDLGSDYGTAAKKPILFSIRSGAIFDAPGQQHTVTNWGVTEQNIGALAERIGEWAAWDSLRRYYQEYAMAVLHMDRNDFRKIMDEYKKSFRKERKEDFTASEMKAVALVYKSRILEAHGPNAIPVTLDEQLLRIIRSIQDSWDNPSMKAYRESRGMTDEGGTAIIIQSMVKGNAAGKEAPQKISGAGAVFSGIWPWEPVNGSIAYRVEGSDIADGVITPLDIDTLRANPRLWAEINDIVAKLSEHYGTRVQLEYTIQNGKFWVLQVRSVPEEGSAPEFDPKSAARAKILADGYRLSGKAVKGPVLSINHLRHVVALAEKYEQKYGNFLSGQTKAAELTWFLREILKQNDLEPQQKASAQLLLTAVHTIDTFRTADPAHAAQTGLIVASDETPPEDLRFLRYFNELSGDKLVVGSISNRGGPGAHEQENAIHLGLTTMAGTTAGEAASFISFVQDDLGTIIFRHGQRKDIALKQGVHMVSLHGAGKFMKVLQGNVRFADDDVPAAPAILDSLFKTGGPKWHLEISPLIEEVLFRFIGMGVAPVFIAAFVLVPETLASVDSIFKIAGVFSISTIISATLNALAHIYADGPAFYERFIYRLQRSWIYAFTFGLSSLLMSTLLIMMVSPFLPVTGTTLAYIALTGAGTAAFISTSQHRRHNKLEAATAKKHVAETKREIRQMLWTGGAQSLFSDASWKKWLANNRSTPMKIAGLSQWRAVTPTLIEQEFTDVMHGSTVLHFNLKDLLEGSLAFQEGMGVQTLRAKLSLIARVIAATENRDAGILLTIGTNQTAESAAEKLALLFAQYSVSYRLSTDEIRRRLIIDHAEKANPFRAAHAHRDMIGGRKIHAFPMKVHKELYWELDFDSLRGLTAEMASNIIIDVISLVKGQQIRLENLPDMMRQILSAA